MDSLSTLSNVLIYKSVDRNRLFRFEESVAFEPSKSGSGAAATLFPLDEGIAHFRLAANGICTKWYSADLLWTRVEQELAERQQNASAVPAASLFYQAVLPLFRNVRSWNSQVIARINQNETTLIKVITQLEYDLDSKNPTVVDWSHGMLRAVLLDRLLWASSTRTAIQERCRRIQIPDRVFKDKSAKSSLQFIRVVKSWPNTVADFVSSWRCYANDRNATFGPGPNPQHVAIHGQGTHRWSNIGIQLLRELNRSETVQHVATARRSIIAASFALLAIVNAEQLPRSQNDTSAEPIENPAAPPTVTSKSGTGIKPKRVGKRKLYHSLRSICGDSFSLDNEDQRDFEIARELYLAGATSPVALLSSINIKPKRRQDRMTLRGAMLALGAATAHVTPSLAIVERDLWEIIVSTAFNGPAGLDDAIESKLDSWQQSSAQQALKEAGLVEWSPSFETFTGVGPDRGGMYRLADALSSMSSDITTHSEPCVSECCPSCDDWLSELANTVRDLREGSPRLQELDGMDRMDTTHDAQCGESFPIALGGVAGLDSDACLGASTLRAVDSGPTATGVRKDFPDQNRAPVRLGLPTRQAREGTDETHDAMDIDSPYDSGSSGDSVQHFFTASLNPDGSYGYPSDGSDRERTEGLDYSTAKSITGGAATQMDEERGPTRPGEDTVRTGGQGASDLDKHTPVTRRAASSLYSSSTNDVSEVSLPGDPRRQGSDVTNATSPLHRWETRSRTASTHDKSRGVSLKSSSKPPYARQNRKSSSHIRQLDNTATKTALTSSARHRPGPRKHAHKSKVKSEEGSEKQSAGRKFTLEEDGVEERLPVYTMQGLNTTKPLQCLGTRTLTYVYHDWEKIDEVELKTRCVTVPIWAGGVAEDLKLFNDIERNAYMSFPGLDDGESGPLRREIWDSRLSSVDGAVKEFPSGMWDAMSEQAKQEVFKWNNVVIRADSKVRSSGVIGWDDKRLRKVLNFRLLRQAHDLSILLKRNAHPNDRIRQAKLEDIKRNAVGPATNVLNFLDAPIPGVRLVDLSANPSATVLDLDDSSQYMSEHSRWFLWKTLPPTESMQWALVANTSAVSGSHIDAGGFGTWVDILHGRKGWYIAVQVENQVPQPGWVNSEYKWIALDLCQGDRLFMRPGTVHAVITTEHCLAVGGHFYCQSTLQRTLQAMVYEHYSRKYITNADHPTSPILLFKMLNGYAEMCTDLLCQHESLPLHPVLPSNSDLASLLLLVWNIDGLEPDDLPREKKWHLTECYLHDRERALALVVELTNICRKHVPDFINSLIRVEVWLEGIVQACEKKCARRSKHFKVRKLSVI